MTDAPDENTPANAQPCVLVVDDEQMVLETLCGLLSHGNYRAVRASDADEAMALLEKEPVDLVITDLMMPETTGWQLLKMIKRRWRDMPVVVLTGYIPDHGEAILKDRGADGYLVKPVGEHDLFALLDSILKSRKPGGRLRAVVFDDEAEALKTLEDLLGRLGLDVDTFDRMEPAFQRIQEQPPDLVSVDLMVPQGSGFDLVSWIRNDPDLANLPVLIVTAEPSPENVKRAIDLRVSGFLAKPFDPHVLEAKVRQALGHSGLRLT